MEIGISPVQPPIYKAYGLDNLFFYRWRNVVPVLIEVNKYKALFYIVADGELLVGQKQGGRD